MTLAVAAALGVALGACGPGPDPRPGDTTLVESSDPVLREMAAGLLPELAERSGMELREPVRLERRSRTELEAYLLEKLDEELPPAEEEALVRSYALLGLAPADLDLRGLLHAVYTEQVAGFYDPDSTALFILDDQPAASLSSLLVHELVHAVQDQAVDLDSLTAPERGNDARVAAQAAIEGHATLVMLEHMMEELQGEEVDLAQVPDFSSLLRPALSGIRTRYPALASAPRVVQESILFPYLEGAGLVQELWSREEGRPPPFGARLPGSTEQVLDPERYFGPPRDAPTTVVLRIPGDVVHTDGLGQLETRIFLEELGADGEAARGWDGDTYVLVEGDAGDGLAWVTVWDGNEERDRFAEAVRARLPALPRPAALEVRDVSGRPVAVLSVGDAPALEIEVEGGRP